MTKLRVAIIGGGAAGLSAAYFIQPYGSVTLFEKNNRFGGHAHTQYVLEGPDKGTPLDIGFMVMNDRTYPTMHKMLKELGVTSIHPTEMSFSFWDQSTDFHYALNLDGSNLFSGAQSPHKRTTSQTNLLGILKDIIKFLGALKKDLKSGTLHNISIQEYLEGKGVSERLVNIYILPMAAAIWSTPPNSVLNYPIEALARFYSNHGLLDLMNPPQWQFIRGGSQLYVNKILQKVDGDFRGGIHISKVVRSKKEVRIEFDNGQFELFDFVVFATHSDTSFELLGNDANDEERKRLEVWKYESNLCVLHTDESHMPPKDSWASWNYIKGKGKDQNSFSISYHLNRLQQHQAKDREYFLTVNPIGEIDPDKILYQTQMDHPTYTSEAIEMQQELIAANGDNRTYFCGSYMGNGFHEDAIKSAFNVGELIKNKVYEKKGSF